MRDFGCCQFATLVSICMDSKHLLCLCASKKVYKHAWNDFLYKLRRVRLAQVCRRCLWRQFFPVPTSHSGMATAIPSNLFQNYSNIMCLF